MNFKKGDEVKVRKDLVVGKFYNNHCFIKEMKEFENKILIIKDVSGDYYLIDDEEYWLFSDKMLEPCTFNKDDLQDDDKVTFRKGSSLIWKNLVYKSEVKQDLTDQEGKKWDIIKVERPTYTTIYERELL